MLSKRLIDGINSRVSHVVRNGDSNGYPGCVNLSFSYVEGESLLMALKVCTFYLKPPPIYYKFLSYFKFRMLHYLPGVRVRLPRLNRLTFSGRLVSTYRFYCRCIGSTFDPTLGAAEDMAHSSLRFGIGRFTTEAEIDYVIEKISSTVQRLRDMRFV